MRNHKTLWITVGLVLLLAVSFAAYQVLSRAHAPAEPEIEVDPSTLAANFTFYDLQGNAVQLSDYAGKPIVLHFWASWCGPCKAELPMFQRLYESYGQDVEFLMVDLTDGARETEQIAKAFLQENGYTFPAYLDLELEGMLNYQVMYLPTTVLIDRSHVVVYHESSIVQERTFEELLHSLLS